MNAEDRDAMVAVARAHAEAEAAGDITTTMGTLDADPLYELQPMGFALRGRDAAQAYYEHFFATFMPRVASYTLRAEWVTDEGLGQEYQMFVQTPNGQRRFDVIGILTFGSDSKLSGERLYASDELLKMMFGPVLDRATPVE